MEWWMCVKTSLAFGSSKGTRTAFRSAVGSVVRCFRGGGHEDSWLLHSSIFAFKSLISACSRSAWLGNGRLAIYSICISALFKQLCSLTSVSIRRSCMRLLSYKGLYALTSSKIRKNVAPAIVKPSQSSGFHFLIDITGTIGFSTRRTSSNAARHTGLRSICGDRIGTNTEQRSILHVASSFERFSKATLTSFFTKSS